MASRSVEIVETVPIKKKKKLTVVMGFAGPGFIGSTAIMFIVRSKGFRPQAYLRSPFIPPMMILIDGKPTHAFRIYVDEREDLLFVISEPLVQSENAYTVSRKLMEWLLEKGAKAFISIEGALFGPITKERTVFAFATDGGDLAEFGVQPTQEGAISGMNACMLDECLRRRIHWTSLFVPTNIVSAIDYRGAAAVIGVLNRMFKLGVDVTPLRERAEMMERIAERQARGERRGFLSSLRRRG